MTLNKPGVRRSLMAVGAVAGFLTLGADPGLTRGIRGSMGGGVGASAMGSHAGGSVNGGFGGQSSGHISSQGTLNTNGPNSTDRDFGRDGAEDRANANANFLSSTHGRSGEVLSTSTNAGGSANANAHRWRHGRHHHYGWRAR